MSEEFMPNLANIVQPDWVICYETLFKNKRYISTWSLYEGLASLPGDTSNLPFHRFLFWQEVNNSLFGRGEQVTRLKAQLLCWPDYNPKYYTFSAGGATIDITFEQGTFTATLYDGSSLQASNMPADFVLGSNMLPQLAIKIRLLQAQGHSTYEGAYFAPETLQVIPYKIVLTNGQSRTNFGETMRLDVEGWMDEVALPDLEFTIRRVQRALPKWSIGQQSSQNQTSYSLYQMPSPDIVRVRDVSIPGSSVEIGGTLSLPPNHVKPYAAALFISGSGRHDRNGFSDGLDLGYHELCDRLATGGLISLRFDTRGAGSTKLGTDILEFGFDQLVDETRGVLEYLRSQPEVSHFPVFLIGHSQGGLIALDLATRDRSVAGVILLATAGRPLDEVLVEQAIAFAQEYEFQSDTVRRLLDNQQLFFESVRNIPEWTPENVPPQIYAERHNRRWFAEILTRDPLQLVANLACPLLVLQGDRDVQVSVRDEQLIVASAKAHNIVVEAKILHDYDHLFKRVSKKTGIRAYYDRRRHVGRDVIRAIQIWIRRIAIKDDSSR